MTDSVPTSIGVTNPGPTQTEGSGSNKRFNRNKGRGKGGGNKSTKSYDFAASVDKALKEDSPDLGAMNQKYFDCSGVDDQVRFSDTIDSLKIYVGENYEPFGQEFKLAIRELNDVTKRPSVKAVTMPQKEDPKNSGTYIDKTEAELTYIEKMRISADLKLEAEQKVKLPSKQGSLYDFIYRRCTSALQAKVMAHTRYTQVDADSDPFELLIIIREIVHNVESSAYLPFSILEQTESLLNLRQGSMTIAQYHTKFKSMMDALATQGGDLCTHTGILKTTANELYEANRIATNKASALTKDETDLVRKHARQRYAAAMFIQYSDPTRFGEQITQMKNSYKGDPSVFPADLQEAVDTLRRWENNRPKRRGNPNSNPNGNPNRPASYGPATS